MSAMIVGHCIHGLGLGGAQKVIAAIAEGRSEGFEHVVYSCEDGVLTEPVRAAGARVRIVERKIPKFDPFWVSQLAASMHEDEIDLVHTHLFGDTLHGVLAAERLGLTSLATMHTVPSGLSRIQRWGYRWLLPKVYRTVACSHSVHQAFSEEEPKISKSLITIPNGAEVTLGEYAPSEIAPARARLGLPPDGVVFACIGRHHPEKCFDRVIDAFAQMPHDAASLLMIGDGEERGALEAQAKRLGVSDRVVFVGARSDVGDLLPLVDVVVFASIYEGLPMALLEAMSAGKCVVGLAIEALEDVLVSGRDALLVPPAELASGLSHVAKDLELRESLGAGAKQKHGEAFSAQRMVRAYESLYSEAFASAPMSRGIQPG